MIRLQSIFRDVFDDAALQLAPATGPADVEGWDSVAQVKLLLAIEDEFQIRFDTDEASGMKTAGQFAQAVEKHLSEQA